MRAKALAWIRQNKKKNSLHLLILVMLLPCIYAGIFYHEKGDLAPVLTPPSEGSTIIAIGGRVNAPSYPGQHNPLFDSNLTSVLALSDLNIVSLTAPISSLATKDAVLRPSILGLLKEGNINTVQLSDHGVLGLGAVGLMETLNHLDINKIPLIGAGLRQDEALAPLYFSNNGQTIALLAVNAHPPPGWSAALNRVGIASAASDDLPEILKDANMKSDVLIVLISFTNMDSKEKQQLVARNIIDQGAHMVVGTGTGSLKPAENYAHGLIIYNLGSLSSPPEMFSYAKEAILLRIQVGPSKSMDIEAVPLLVTPKTVKIAGNRFLQSKIAKRLGNSHWTLGI